MAAASGTWRGSCSTQQRCSSTTTQDADADQQQQQKKQKKLHTLKCTKGTATPVSQAIAFMLGRDLIEPQQLTANMDVLAQQMADGAATHSSTEMSAFAEACRKIGYSNPATFAAMMAVLAPQADSIAADELPPLLWAASTLAQQQQGAEAGPPPGSTSGSSSSSSSVGVPQNDGVIGSINSSRLLGLPHVLQFVLGASQVLAGDLDALDGEELPVVAAALADMEYRDPFLLTVLAECVLERRRELSEGELLALLQAYAAMGPWFYDSRLLNALTDELLARAAADADGGGGGGGKEQQALREALQRVGAALAAIKHKHKRLQEVLEQQR